ncbi:MAG: insulinase family protein, partial [Nitrospinota bacterium]
LTFHPPPAERVVLDNGMVIYLLEDHSLPLFRLHALIRTGSIYDPPDKAGVATLTGQVLRDGGTERMDSETLNEELDFIAASLETDIGLEMGSVSLSLLQKDIDVGLAILADVLRRPVFSEDAFLVAKGRLQESIRRENDQAGRLASREFRKQLYAHSPYGRYPTLQSVSRIQRADLQAFHRRYFVPNNLILAIAGDFERAALLQKLQDLFADWAPQQVSFPPLPEVKPPPTMRVYYIEKEIPQTQIRLGTLGIRRNSPDLFPVRVMNYILGSGGFAARLFRTVRSERGLAYDVGSFFDLFVYQPGPFLAFAETKASSTYAVVSLMREEIDRIRTEPVSDEELAAAKEAIINRFVFAFDSSAEVVMRRALVEYEGLPPDYLETYRERIAAVSKEDVLRVAQKYLQPERMILLLVGNKAAFDKPLEAFGPVTTLSLPTEN